MARSRQDLQDTFAHATETGDIIPVLDALLSLTNISSVHGSVVEWLEKTHAQAYPQQPFSLVRFEELWKHCLTYDELFSQDFDGAYFPALIFAMSVSGIDFYVMLETGRVVAIHHDVLTETGSDIMDMLEEADNVVAFDNLLVEENSGFNLEQFLAIQTEFAETKEMDLDDIPPQEFFPRFAKCLGWTLEELYTERYHVGFEFLLHYMEEHEAILQRMAE